MADPSKPHDPRSKRAVLQQGAGALATLFVVGALVMKPRIQSGLEEESRRVLADAGIPATVDFVFQDGRILCAEQLDDPEAARALVLEVRGVRSVTIDTICIDGPPDGNGPGDTRPTVPDTSTTAAPSTSAAPTTTAGPSTSSTTTTTTGASSTTSPAAAATSISLSGGRLTLSGTVASENQRAALVDAARAAVDPANVTDRLVVDTTLDLDDADISGLTQLIAAMPVPLVFGEVGWDGAALIASGQYVDAAARAEFEAACERVGVTPALDARPVATPDDADDVKAAVNALVSAEPILFGKGDIVISPASTPTVQRVAGILKRFSGMAIEVQGHTDSEGDPGRNLTLSEQRAQAVADAIVTLGVPGDEVTSKGFGETDLITDNNGVEIPEQSRRVVFGVTANR